MAVIFKDIDPMPFGKYKGKPMLDVPADYLHWLWTNEKSPLKGKQGSDPVATYIFANLDALREEYDDGIW